ncbi:uncharacterized protein [Arachis hypogaea]|uniref:uncharacterized protein isoform X2 n=1 Tax=Arachis hypogaea TaxID=3818 RepID=UPI003B21C235|nr:uncharacterized protein DS421_16g562580 [Arachis hypogaea]
MLLSHHAFGKALLVHTPHNQKPAILLLLIIQKKDKIMKEEEGENITKTRRSRESFNDCGAANGVGVVAATVMANNNNNNHNNNSNKGNYNYKFWVLAAIIVLALWSMFTGSVTLKWSASNLTRFSHDLDHSITLQDLDVLEVEEREKVVRRMWEVYTHSTTAKVPRFWSDAFHAAYEHLNIRVSRKMKEEQESSWGAKIGTKQ